MEKEGLVRSVDFLQQHGITIRQFVSDRHIMVAKWENMLGTKHYVDVWHVAKGGAF